MAFRGWLLVRSCKIFALCVCAPWAAVGFRAHGNDEAVSVGADAGIIHHMNIRKNASKGPHTQSAQLLAPNAAGNAHKELKKVVEEVSITSHHFPWSQADSSLLQAGVKITSSAWQKTEKLAEGTLHKYAPDQALVAGLLGLALFTVPCVGMLICMFSDVKLLPEATVSLDDENRYVWDDEKDTAEHPMMLRPPRHARLKTLPAQLPGHSWEPIMSSGGESSAADISDKPDTDSDQVNDDKEGGTGAASSSKEPRKHGKKKKGAAYGSHRSMPANVGPSREM